MSYTDGESSWGKKIGAVVGILIAGVLGKALFAWGTGEYQRRTFDLDDSIVAMERSQPEIASLFTALKTSLPDEYSRFKADAEARFRRGASSEDLRTYGGEQMRAIMQRHKQDLARAPSSDLAAYRDAQLAVLDLLRRESDVLCAHFAMSGLLPSDRPSAEALRLLARAGQVQLAGIAAGAKAGVDRPTVMAEADAVALVEHMQALGLTQTQLAVFAAPQRLAAADSSTQCMLGEMMMKSVAQLPPAQSDRWTAFLISQG